MRPDEHLHHLLDLLELEAEAEAERTREMLQGLTAKEAERSGLSLLSLRVVDERSAPGGRSVLQLTKRDPAQPLPWTRLGVGAPVLLYSEALEPLRGVLSQKDRRSVSVTFATAPEDFPDGDLRLDLCADEITTARQKSALNQAIQAKDGRLNELKQILCGTLEPSLEEVPSIDLPALNEPQRKAVQLTLQCKDIALIHGPPGTGKTFTVARSIARAVERGESVLATAPSNMACDNLVEQLVALQLNVIRLGHPARISKALMEHSLDVRLENHEDAKLAKKLIKEAWALRKQASRFTRAKPLPGERAQKRAEARRMLWDARKLMDRAAERLLDQADVLCATTSVDAAILKERSFDLVVIDEAAQCTEPNAWVPLRYGHRLLLAGDHQQLPPTIISTEASQEGLQISLFERLIELLGPEVQQRLSVQYRMHQDIMGFSSEVFYEGTLQAHESVQAHLLPDLPDVETTALTERAAEFIDTAGASYEETQEPGGESRLNEQEAQLAAHKVNALLSAGVRAEQIGVIAPYSAQVRELTRRLPEVEVRSIDGFQGREKEVIVISLVRSNPDAQVGFLADTRRMNVALTRARRKLIVIGDSATLSSHPFYNRMLGYFEQLGGYRTVWEEELP